VNTNHRGPDSTRRHRLRTDGPTSGRRPRRAAGKGLLETLESRSLLTVLPTAVTLSPTPVEGISTDVNTIVATFYSPADPNAGDFSASINWGSGTPGTTAGTIVSLSSAVTANGYLFAVEGGGNTYSEDSLGQTLSVDVTIHDLVDNSDTSIISHTTVADAPLTAGTPQPTVSAIQGIALTGAQVAEFTDANPNAPVGDFSATIDWGDGTPIQGGQITQPGGIGTPFFVVGSHTYPQPSGASPYTISVSIKDVGGSTLNTSTTAAVASAALTATGVTLTEPIYPPIAATITIATFTDANPTAPTTQPGISQTYSATIDWGDGVVTPGTVTWDAVLAHYNVGGTHQYAALGTYQPIIHIMDIGGQSATASSTLTIADTPLTAGASTTFNGVEGRPATGQVATFTSPNLLSKASDYSATINWGDGTPPSTGVVSQLADGTFAVQGTHTYAEESLLLPYFLQVTVKDAGVGGSTVAIPAEASIADAPLTSQGSPISGVEGTALPATTTVATFTDRDVTGTASDYTAIINWGDGTAPVPGTIVATGATPNGVTFSVEGSHLYTNKGSYQTTVVVFDAGGSQTLAVGNAVMADAPATAAPISFSTTVDQQFNGPVAFFFQNYGPPTGLQPGSNYTATIIWGDGTPPSLGTIVPVAGGFDVYGVHTYLLARTTSGSNQFPVTVSIHDNGGAVTTVVAAATVNDVPVTAQLDPATDTGLSHVDGITKDAQPRFFGTGEAYATIKLFAAPFGTSSYTLVGQTSSDNSGAWSIISGRLADGKYSIVVQEIDGSGTVLATQGVMPNVNQGPLVIDTAGPKVTSVFLDRLHGQVDITYADNLSGLDYAEIANSANYTFTKLGARSTAYQVTSIFARSTAADPESEAILTINNGKPLRGGIYTLTILSGDGATGVRDVAGNALDGEFYGTFPSGNNVPGGNFVAEIDTIHNVIFAPKSVIGYASPIAPGFKPTATIIPTVNPKNAALLARQARREQLVLAQQGAQANAASARLAAHDAALAKASAKRRG
jgi:hypothetical protein